MKMCECGNHRLKLRTLKLIIIIHITVNVGLASNQPNDLMLDHTAIYWLYFTDHISALICLEYKYVLNYLHSSKNLPFTRTSILESRG